MREDLFDKDVAYHVFFTGRLSESSGWKLEFDITDDGFVNSDSDFDNKVFKLLFKHCNQLCDELEKELDSKE